MMVETQTAPKKFDDTKIAARFAEYKALQAERQRREAEEKAEAEKRRAFYAEECKPRVVTAHKSHVCCRCGAGIAVGEQVSVEVVTTGFGWREGLHFQSRYVCGKCLPIKEEAER